MMNRAEMNVIGTFQQEAIELWSLCRMLRSALENCRKETDQQGIWVGDPGFGDDVYAFARAAEMIEDRANSLAKRLEPVAIQQEVEHGT